MPTIDMIFSHGQYKDRLLAVFQFLEKPQHQIVRLVDDPGATSLLKDGNLIAMLAQNVNSVTSMADYFTVDTAALFLPQV
jgi:hypothetical protein